jgi:hypothetical protein
MSSASMTQAVKNAKLEMLDDMRDFATDRVPPESIGRAMILEWLTKKYKKVKKE